MRPTLFVPVENQVRELDAKLLFACVAAERGYPVVMGAKQPLYFALPDFAPGVFIAKSMRARSKLMFDIIRGLGHELLAWDEESLVRFDSPQYYTWRFSPDTFNAIRHLFAWGADDAQMFAAYAHNRGVTVHATGNPRVDLLRPEVRGYFAEDVRELRERYGEYILINTNFSFVNPYLAATALVVPRGRSGVRPSRTGSGLSTEFAAGMATHQDLIFAAFRELMPALAERFPTRLIVVRPHPSENHDVWRELLAPYPNVEVRHEGNVIPWLLSAACLVHNGCTTAVEAALAARPAVAFRPVQSTVYDYVLPNGLSHQSFSIDETLDLVGAILSGRRALIAKGERDRIFARHVCSTTGDLASDRIVDVLETLGYARGMVRAGVIEYALARTKSAIRTRIKLFNMRRREHWAGDRYNRHRFPGVSLVEMNQRIDRFRHVLGRFESVRATACSASLYRVEAVAAPGAAR